MSDPTFPIRSRARQLAEYLCEAIVAGSIADPLPGTRVWSKSLGVSRVVLGQAIKQLRQEGWIGDQPRGARLHLRRSARPKRCPAPRPVVRVLLYQSYQPRLSHYRETYRAMSDRISSLGADVRWEIASATRLRELALHPRSDEPMVLLGVPLIHQRLMVQFRKPVIVVGDVPTGLPIPSVCVDNAASVRHATNSLLRRGSEFVGLIYAQGAMLGTKRFVLSFSDACAKWPGQPVRKRLIPTALDRQSLDLTVRRLGFGAPARSGFIVMSPIPLGMVMTALLQRRLEPSWQFEVAAMGHHLEEAMLYPPPLHYPFPMEQIARHIGNAVARYLSTGQLDPVTKTIVPELAAKWRQ
jgi:DNA-binding LacI/PurR family transcriptional regulator